MRRWVWLVLLASGAACTSPEYGVDEEEALVVVGVPDIVVQPGQIDFGTYTVGQEVLRSLQILNRGDAVLSIDGLSLGPNGAFSVVDELPALGIEPGHASLIEVWYTATNVLDESWVDVRSNDPDTPSLQIPLTGGARLPELLIQPNPYVFGATAVGCESTGIVDLMNVGQAPLTIESVVQAGEGFVLGELAPFPQDVAVGSALSVELRFAPLAALEYSGGLVVRSNDPRGEGTSEHTGSGEAAIQQIDTFQQILTDWTTVDLLFHVDRSGSMGGDAANLASNFDLFTDFLLADGIDYQVMVVTADSGCHNEQIITPATVNAAHVFDDATHGPGGAWTEAGLTIVRNALQNIGPGQCNEGFLRPDVNPIVVMLSDEPEQSAGPWLDFVQEIEDIAPEVVLNAIVGPPVADTCGSAPGDGYYEAADYTGGEALNICADDWGDHFDQITTIEEPIAEYALTADPVPESIVVWVDGIAVGGWAYDADLNAVVFFQSMLPGPGTEIEVVYDLEHACP